MWRFGSSIRGAVCWIFTRPVELHLRHDIVLGGWIPLAGCSKEPWPDRRRLVRRVHPVQHIQLRRDEGAMSHACYTHAGRGHRRGYRNVLPCRLTVPLQAQQSAVSTASIPRPFLLLSFSLFPTTGQFAKTPTNLPCRWMPSSLDAMSTRVRPLHSCAVLLSVRKGGQTITKWS